VAAVPDKSADSVHDFVMKLIYRFGACQILLHDQVIVSLYAYCAYNITANITVTYISETFLNCSITNNLIEDSVI